MRSRVLVLGVAVGLVVVAPGCARSSSTGADGRIAVVAAEASWGDLARELGGTKTDVRVLVDSPDLDPHDYEPTADDAVAFTKARLVVTNGIGYDAWARKLLAANPVAGRAHVDVGEVVGVPDDGNPHQWYSPPAVEQVADAITAELVALAPEQRAYFEARRRRLDAEVLDRYHSLVDEIRRTYGGTPIGATESIVEPLAAALGLSVRTPHRFLVAVSEGGDPSGADKATVDRQLADREVRVFVYNAQNATPDVRRLVATSRAAGIPVVTVTETPPRAHQSFASWQVGQLEALRAALASATAKP